MQQLFILLAAIVVLVILILRKLHPFLALLLVSIALGIALQMPLPKIISTLQNGIGSTLAQLAPIIALGAIFGGILERSGAITAITKMLVSRFGNAHIKWAALLVGFVVGIPLFYNAGFVLLVPLVFTLSAMSGTPLVVIAISMMAALSVTHGLLPPHPSPVALAGIFKADIGKTMFYGLCIALPAAIIAGPIFARTLHRIVVPAAPIISPTKISEQKLPGSGLSFLIALLPVFIIGISHVLVVLFSSNSQFANVFTFTGDPLVALLLSVFAALFFLGTKLGFTTSSLMEDATKSVSSVAMIMLIIAAGGAFKQVLVDSGIGTIIAEKANHLALSPLVLGWLIAALIRLALGSATVAGLTAAGIVLPLIQSSGASPELMVLAVGAGSLFGSHVNDTGFWMFKEYFNLTMKQTFLSWSLMEIIVSICGLIGVLICNQFL